MREREENGSVIASRGKGKHDERGLTLIGVFCSWSPKRTSMSIRLCLSSR